MTRGFNAERLLGISDDLRVDPYKACFDEIYTKSCPREYYRVLYGLDYIIPDLAHGIFANVVGALERQRGRPLKILDVGCSYGNNAVLLRMPIDFHRLAQRYADLSGHRLSTAELVDLDRQYFRSWPRHPMTIVGLDASVPAVSYASDVGVIDHGLALDLENGELTETAREALRDVDLIISTGCIGYVTERTFAKVLGAIEGPPPWIASFVLRMYSFTSIADELTRRGLTTERLDSVTFVQRRFHSKEEFVEVLSALEARGIATDGKESDGLLHAEFFLSRPEADISKLPLSDVATVTTGARHSFGCRYHRNPDNVVRLWR